MNNLNNLNILTKYAAKYDQVSINFSNMDRFLVSATFVELFKSNEIFKLDQNDWSEIIKFFSPEDTVKLNNLHNIASFLKYKIREQTNGAFYASYLLLNDSVFHEFVGDSTELAKAKKVTLLGLTLIPRPYFWKDEVFCINLPKFKWFDPDLLMCKGILTS